MHGKKAKYEQILELQKLLFDSSLKKPSKWPGGRKYQMPTTKIDVLTKNYAKVHPITINSSKISTSMRYLKFIDFTSRASKSKFLL